MPRARGRRPLVVAALLVLLVAAAAVALLTHGHRAAGGGPARAAPTGIEPLAFMPPGAPNVLDLDTRVPSAAAAATALVPKLKGAPLTADDVAQLVGGRMAVAFGGGRVWLAAVTPARPPRPRAGAAAGARGGTVVVAPSPGQLQTALARAPAAARGARAAFDRGFTGLPAASMRVAFDPRALLAAGSRPIAGTRWGRSLRAGAAVLVYRDDRLVVPFRISADPAGLTPADLPIATGALPPRAHGGAPIVAAVRSPAQTLAFMRATGLIPALDLLASAPGFLRPDLSNLGTEATIGSADGRALTVRMTPPDPGDWSTKLGRLDALSGLIRLAGLADVRIDKASDGVYSIERNGSLGGRVGVYGPVVVFSNDPHADLRAVARAPRAAPVEGAAGALTLRLAPSLFGALLPTLVSRHVGDVTGWARAELSGLRGTLAVRLR